MEIKDLLKNNYKIFCANTEELNQAGLILAATGDFPIAIINLKNRRRPAGLSFQAMPHHDPIQMIAVDALEKENFNCSFIQAKQFIKDNTLPVCKNSAAVINEPAADMTEPIPALPDDHPLTKLFKADLALLQRYYNEAIALENKASDDSLKTFYNSSAAGFYNRMCDTRKHIADAERTLKTTQAA